MEDLFKKFGIHENEYFLTGSRALSTETYKIYSDESDYDYVVSIKQRHYIINYLNAIKIKIDSSCYNGGFKFNYKGKTINIITACDVEFKAWREALVILKLLINTDEVYRKAIKNKFSRYCSYEQLRGLIKTIINFANIN